MHELGHCVKCHDQPVDERDDDFIMYPYMAVDLVYYLKFNPTISTDINSMDVKNNWSN